MKSKKIVRVQCIYATAAVRAGKEYDAELDIDVELDDCVRITIIRDDYGRKTTYYRDHFRAVRKYEKPPNRYCNETESFKIQK